MFVYIALDKEANTIKVGISVDPQNRVKGLNHVQDSLLLELYYCNEFDKETAMLCEKKLLGYLRFNYNMINLDFAGCTETFMIEDTEEYNKVVDFCKDYLSTFAKLEDMDAEYLAKRAKYRFDTFEKFLVFVQYGCEVNRIPFYNRVQERTLQVIFNSGNASSYTNLGRQYPSAYTENGASRYARSVVEYLPDDNFEEHY